MKLLESLLYFIVSETESDTIQTDKGLIQTDENICLNLGSYLSES